MDQIGTAIAARPMKNAGARNDIVLSHRINRSRLPK